MTALKALALAATIALGGLWMQTGDAGASPATFGDLQTSAPRAEIYGDLARTAPRSGLFGEIGKVAPNSAPYATDGGA